jgi:hypothetical protein
LFPEDIFKFWMDEYIDQIGWPPSDDPSSLPSNRWCGLFLQQPLSFWQTVSWVKSRLSLSLQLMEVRHMIILMDLIGQAHSTAPIHRLPADLRQRVAFQTQYFHEHGHFIAPVALFRQADGRFQILDGFHRVAALVSMHGQRSDPMPELDAWIGSRK